MKAVTLDLEKDKCSCKAIRALDVAVCENSGTKDNLE